MSDPKAGPKRSQLAQGRSRGTRQSIIKAALELWGERGYDTGIDDTTAEEIAARAGVAKATFYFHFARKDDILLETGWLTAKVFYEDAIKGLAEGGAADDVIEAITGKLCRRIEVVPRLGLQRMLRAQSAAESAARPRADDPEHVSFRRAFAVVCLQAQQDGTLPQTIPPAEAGLMFESLLMSALHEWAYDEQADLPASLRTRFAVLLAGIRGVQPESVGRTGKPRRARPKAG